LQGKLLSRLIAQRSKSNTAAWRDMHMRPHREYLDQRKPILVLAGATRTDDGSVATGSLFIINAQTRAEAEAFFCK
jgi:uncharacterized protein YciI